MSNLTLLSKDLKSSDISAKEYSFAKEIRSSFWDGMISEQVNYDELKKLDLVLEFIKDDY